MTRTSLGDLLQQKAASYAAETLKNKQLIDEWQAAIDALFTHLRNWLEASDPSGILQIEVNKVDVNEPNVGRYEVPRLDIRAFGKWVGIIPKARKTIKTAQPPQVGAPERATGRVDITDEIRRYVLYRFSRETGDEWCIEGPADDSCAPLTREQFEEALTSYFR